jgi:hypothetical protein
MKQINLTMLSNLLHTVYDNAKSLTGFGSPKPGGWPPILSGFFTSVICAFSFMGGLFWGGLAPCRPGSVFQPYYKLPAHVSHGWR